MILLVEFEQFTNLGFVGKRVGSTPEPLRLSNIHRTRTLLADPHESVIVESYCPGRLRLELVLDGSSQTGALKHCSVTPYPRLILKSWVFDLHCDAVPKAKIEELGV